MFIYLVILIKIVTIFHNICSIFLDVIIQLNNATNLLKNKINFLNRCKFLHLFINSKWISFNSNHSQFSSKFNNYILNFDFTNVPFNDPNSLNSSNPLSVEIVLTSGNDIFTLENNEINFNEIK